MTSLIVPLDASFASLIEANQVAISGMPEVAQLNLFQHQLDTASIPEVCSSWFLLLHRVDCRVFVPQVQRDPASSLEPNKQFHRI